jgi:hypothetical protein
MDFLEQIKEEERFKKSIKIFKYLSISIITGVIALSIFFTVKKQRDKERNLITERISDLIAEDKLNDNLLKNPSAVLAKYKNNKSIKKNLFVYTLIQSNASLAHENIKSNRDHLNNLINDNQLSKNSLLNLAKIIWMTKALDSYKTNLIGTEKEQFKAYEKSFNNENEPFFFRAKILLSLFLLHEGDVKASKQNLKMILSSTKAQNSIKEEARELLSTI